MAFEPFGYRFEIVSTMPPDEAKAAICAKRRGWFDAKRGPRGWSLGPLLCLWNSAFDQRGPMVLARISSDGFGSRINGRAGSDLNGTMYAAALYALLAILLVPMLRDGLPARGVAVMGVVFLLAPLIFWWAHKDRNEADLLVNFLRRTLETRKPSPHGAAEVRCPATTALPMRLDNSGEEEIEAASPEQVRDALRHVAEQGDGFVILALADETYMQTAWDGDGFILEKREGSKDRHFVVIRAAEADGAPRAGSSLTLPEAEAAFAAFCAQQPLPAPLVWQPLRP